MFKSLRIARLVSFTFAVVVLSCTTVRAEVIISEIMYNPASDEGTAPNDVEWIEIYNTGDEPADIGGWYLKDEDGRTAAIKQGATLQPHAAAVLVPGEQTPEDFHAAWGDGFDVHPLADWNGGGMKGLANQPSDTNEILSLCKADAAIADTVNYDDQGDWPTDKPDGPSIYLVAAALHADANDDGKNWRRAQVDVAAARGNTQTEDFDGQDVGSPGKVDTTAVEAVEEPDQGGGEQQE